MQIASSDRGILIFFRCVSILIFLVNKEDAIAVLLTAQKNIFFRLIKNYFDKMLPTPDHWQKYGFCANFYLLYSSYLL